MDVVRGSLPPASPEQSRRLRSLWPPRLREPAAGYRRVPVEALDLLDAGWLAPDAAAAVVSDGSGAAAVLPLVVDGPALRAAEAGDGLASMLVDALRTMPGRARPSAGEAGRPEPPGLHLLAFDPIEPGPSDERSLGTDQTNTSVVVGKRAIVKWRTAPGADGARALQLRRHLRDVGSTATPPLLGALVWASGRGQDVVLADVDGYLDDAIDGWDACIAELAACMEGGGPDDQRLATSLGGLAAKLHADLARPSSIIHHPLGEAGMNELRAWRRESLALLERALAIEATDAGVVRDAEGWLRRDLSALDAVAAATVQPIHGDLHVGQVVHWSGGQAVIDFDGAPGTGVGGSSHERAPTARDVAQLLTSLDLLAVVVDGRTDGRHAARLRDWRSEAREALLSAYRAGIGASPAAVTHDERLLAPFIARQLCHELVYAAEVLPRWRYAPIGVLRWRSQEEPG
jgi:maltokinase